MRLWAVVVLSAAIYGCGDDADGGGSAGAPAGDGGQGGTGGMPEAGGQQGGAPAVMCDVFANWSCQTANAGCFATCDSNQIACDAAKCAYATSQSSSEICQEYDPENLDGCADCEAAFNAGCI